MKDFLKKKLMLLLVCLLVFSMTNYTTGYANGSLSDIQNHWAEDQIGDWINRGLVKGYMDGTFRPNANITRAEFITLVNGVIKPVEKENIDFKDVKNSDWFKDQIEKAIYSGYISGYEDNTMQPNNPITRQEAAIIISKLLKLDKPKSASILSQFSDEYQIASWSKDAVGVVVEKGYMNGYPDGTHKPTKPITRAESIAMLNKVIGELYSENGVYGPANGMDVINKNLTITGQDVTLKNTKIIGTLYLAEGIGNGDVTLDNVEVDGDVIIKGGGENSIIFKDSSLNSVIVYKANGKVRVVASGNTKIDKAIMKSGAKLQEENATGEGFGEVEVFEVAKDNKIELDGDFKNVEIEGKAEVAVTEKTVIKELKVSEAAQDATVNLAKGTTVENMSIEAKTKIEGEGTVKNATVKAEGTSFEKAPEKSTIDKGVEVEIAGKIKTGSGKTESNNHSRSSGGGSSSGGSSGGGTTPTPTPTPDTIELHKKASFIGAPTIDMKVKLNNSWITNYELYYNNSLIATDQDNDGVIRVVAKYFDDITKLKVKYNAKDYTDSNNQFDELID